MYLPKAITMLALTMSVIVTAFPADRAQATVWQGLDRRERTDAAIASSNARASNAPLKCMGCAVDEVVSDEHADVKSKASRRPKPTGAIITARDVGASVETFRTVTAHPAWATEDAATEVRAADAMPPGNVCSVKTLKVVTITADAVSPQWPWPTPITPRIEVRDKKSKS